MSDRSRKSKKIHPDSLWVEIKSAAAEIDRRVEVLAIAVPANKAFHRHDSAVDSLGDRIVDFVRAVAHDVRQSLFDRPRNLLPWFEFRVDNAAIPLSTLHGIGTRTCCD